MLLLLDIASLDPRDVLYKGQDLTTHKGYICIWYPSCSTERKKAPVQWIEII